MLQMVIMRMIDLVATTKNESINRPVLMIYDDDPDNMKIFHRVFQEKCDTIITKSGEECLAKYVNESCLGKTIEVLLLDYKMSDMRAGEIARQVKSINGTKVFIVSAYPLEDKWAEALKETETIFDFLKKPIKMSKLKERVHQAMQSSTMAYETQA
jgi:response regulator RpfG family c-di-GMP phosphodiesterase